MIQRLDVYLWDQKVGTLSAYIDKYTEKACFYYDQKFLKTGLDPSPLTNSAKTLAAQRGLPIYAESEKQFRGLPAFISDSLPEYWGNKLFAAWAKAKGINTRKLSSLDMLGYIGRRGMGALEFLPPSEPSLEKSEQVSINGLYQQSKVALDSALSFHTSSIPDLIIESLFRVGTSAGGRRPKAIVNIDYQTGECLSGQVAPPDKRFVPSIIKFDEGIDRPSTRIEYAYYLMALAAGIKMMPSRLVEAGGQQHFITQRYDRCHDLKLHAQTLCALMPTADSYEDLLTVAAKMGSSPDALTVIFLAITMNVICCNVDDHNKNFCFIMDREGKWSFAPTYDFTFSVDFDAPRYANQHSMSICGKTSGILRDDLISIAQDFNIKNPNQLIDKCIQAAVRFPEWASAAKIDERWTTLIANEIKTSIQTFDSNR